MEQISIIEKKPSVLRAARIEFTIPSRYVRGAIKWFSAIALVSIIFYLAGNKPVGGLFVLALGAIWLLGIFYFYFLSVSRPSPALKKGGQIYKLDFGGARRVLYLSLLEEDAVDISLLYDFFGRSKFMDLLPSRMGVTQTEIKEFLKTKTALRSPINISQKEAIEKLVQESDASESDVIGAKEFALLLFDYDQAFAKFLFDREIRKDELKGAASWTAAHLEKQRKNDRWWEKNSLGRIPSIGRGLSYGFTYNLDKFSRELAPKKSGGAMTFLAHRKEIFEIEEILSKSAEANVLMIGEEGSGKHTILEGLAQIIKDGSALPALAHKRMIILDTPSLTATSKTKTALEETLIKIMSEAVNAGNIVLVMENFSEFLDSASSMGVNVIAILERYLESNRLQFIALANPENFHRALETNSKITKLFAKIEIGEPSEKQSEIILESAAENIEQRTGVTITYQAVKSAVDLADRFVAEGAMPEKAIDLLDQAASSATTGKTFLLPIDIEKVIEEKTKINVGKIGEEESKKLLNLEEFLHHRVIGQDEAIKAVANALRRARTGLHTGKRPIGSFLFLGPTGVGKTETAKTLAEVYFGSEKSMIRFDMSEFQGEEGVRKLIGSFDAQEPGSLASSLRDHPFSIILFDEFEKSSKAVVNLFLQILDEGVFKDAFNKKVSARDSIIIATSNSGSNLIWDLMQKGQDPTVLQKEVIDFVRREGMFSPELLNRFDAIIIYHPLAKDQLKKVAKILLQDLAKRLKTKDIDFIITDTLAEKIVEIGYDPIMGARPMRRAITNKVEQFIAKKILEKKLDRGSALELSADEIANL